MGRESTDPKTKCREMCLSFHGYTSTARKKTPPPPDVSNLLSQHISPFLSFLCFFYAVYHWFTSSHPRCSERILSSPNKTKPNGNEFMHHILPFSGLSQDTTHHYCHSLFQSCCYILKTLGAGVVLIPDYCPAQCIQQGQTPFKPVFIASLTIDIITCARGTD